MRLAMIAASGPDPGSYYLAPVAPGCWPGPPDVALSVTTDFVLGREANARAGLPVGRVVWPTLHDFGAGGREAFFVAGWTD